MEQNTDNKPELPGMPAKTKLGILIEKRQELQDKIDNLNTQKVFIGREIEDIFREQKKKKICTEVNGKKITVILKTYGSRIAVLAD